MDRFNDGVVDKKGRFVTGTMSQEKGGAREFNEGGWTRARNDERSLELTTFSSLPLPPSSQSSTPSTPTSPPPSSSTASPAPMEQAGLQTPRSSTSSIPEQALPSTSSTTIWRREGSRIDESL